MEMKMMPALSGRLPRAGDASGGTAIDEGRLGRLRRAWMDYAAYRATVGRLRALDDAQLADIGLARAGLGEIAREAVYGR